MDSVTYVPVDGDIFRFLKQQECFCRSENIVTTFLSRILGPLLGGVKGENHNSFPVEYLIYSSIFLEWCHLLFLLFLFTKLSQ
jgi:hypothetical protein